MNQKLKSALIVTTTNRYLSVVICSIIISVAGVLYGIYSGKAEHGARGGAIATILSLTSLLINRKYDVYAFNSACDMAEVDNLTETDFSPDFNPELITFDKFRFIFQSWIGAKSRSDKEKNIYIIVASLFGTFFWGFGDVIAAKFIHQPVGRFENLFMIF